jgi:hypothetical protein
MPVSSPLSVTGTLFRSPLIWVSHPAIQPRLLLYSTKIHWLALSRPRTGTVLPLGIQPITALLVLGFRPSAVMLSFVIDGVHAA